MNTSDKASWKDKQWPEESVKTSKEFDQQLFQMISSRIRNRIVGQDFLFLFVRGFGSIVRNLMNVSSNEIKTNHQPNHGGDTKES